VKAAAQAPLRHGRTVPAVLPPLPVVPRDHRRVEIVLIGTSTGGPQALKVVIPRLPADFPVPIAMVLHMPIGYTETYAEKLNEMSALTVIEAKGDEEVVAGLVFLAPAGRHLTFRRDADGIVRTALELRPLDTPHRPAVDVLFRSAAAAYGPAVLGVVLTGMGADGREGAAWIKANGGQIVTEAEETCVVYGMPRSVVEAGLSDEVIAIDRVAEVIMERV
jgi:two-component system, chemotaxis family, protein-glutamate methylesterase/glutaminase